MDMKDRRRGARRGFTLVELLVVVAVIAVLLSILYPLGVKGVVKAKLVTCRTQLKNFHNATFLYGTDEALPGVYPRYGGTTVDAPHEGSQRSFRILYPSNPVLAVYTRGQYLTNPDKFFCPLLDIDPRTYFNPEPNWVQDTFWSSYIWYWQHVPGAEEVPLRPGNDPNNPSGSNRSDITAVREGSETILMSDYNRTYWETKGHRVRHEHYQAIFADGAMDNLGDEWSDVQGFLY